MARINAGDAESGLAALDHRYHKRIYGLVNSIVRDAHLAEDATQDVFTKLFLNSHLYNQGTCFIAWLSGIARNQALSAIRSRRSVPSPMTNLFVNAESGYDLESLHGGTVDRRAEEQELMSEFELAVSGLPERYQTVFRECVVKGRPYRHVADELGIPIGTVAIRIMRARKRLYAELSHHMGRLRRPPACLQ
jgi:RNA polymerase sigma-70 factor (ECF subfamily)